MERGILGFEVTPAGNLADCAENVERLSKLWLDRSRVDGDDLGPGDPGDFDFGAWHIACHLVAAGGVRRSTDGRLLWLEISHHGATDSYFPSVTVHNDGTAHTVAITSAEGRLLLRNSTLLGFVEGNSLGRTSARAVNDSPTRFNGWRRQDFDQPAGSGEDGGKVWEHWCTTRDIRPSSIIGSSVLTAYISLVSSLGDRFVAAVARGRRDYYHPKQLAELVRAGFVGEASALWEATPTAIPESVESLLIDAQPDAALRAIEQVDWANSPRYHMFTRRIDRWVAANELRPHLLEP